MRLDEIEMNLVDIIYSNTFVLTLAEKLYRDSLDQGMDQDGQKILAKWSIEAAANFYRAQAEMGR